MRGIGAACAALTLSLAGARRGLGQNPVRAGARVRYRDRVSSAWSYAVAVRGTPDTLVVAECPGCSATNRAVTPLSAYDVEVQRGGHGSRGANAFSGALIGAGAGLAVDLLAIRKCEHDNPHTDGPPCAIGIVFAPALAAGGAAVGIIAGLLVPTAYWTRIDSATTR